MLNWWRKFSHKPGNRATVGVVRRPSAGDTAGYRLRRPKLTPVSLMSVTGCWWWRSRSSRRRSCSVRWSASRSSVRDAHWGMLVLWCDRHRPPVRATSLTPVHVDRRKYCQPGAVCAMQPGHARTRRQLGIRRVRPHRRLPQRLQGAIYTRWRRKKELIIFFCVHLFSTRQKPVIFFHIR